MLERGRIDRLKDIGDAVRGIAIDSLLILEEQDDPAFARATGQLGHPLDHGIAVGCRIVAGRDVEAEDANPRRLVEVGQIHGPLEALKVLAERIGDPDLADRRPDGAELEPACGQQPPELGVLRVRQIQDVRTMDGAKLDELDAVLRQDIELFVGILGDLVGKGTDANHRSLPGSRIANRGSKSLSS